MCSTYSFPINKDTWHSLFHFFSGIWHSTFSSNIYYSNNVGISRTLFLYDQGVCLSHVARVHTFSPSNTYISYILFSCNKDIWCTSTKARQWTYGQNCNLYWHPSLPSSYWVVAQEGRRYTLLFSPHTMKVFQSLFLYNKDIWHTFSKTAKTFFFF